MCVHEIAQAEPERRGLVSAQAVGGFLGGLIGGAVGGAIGTFLFPGVGTLVGGGLGGWAGHSYGREFGTFVYEWLFGHISTEFADPISSSGAIDDGVPELDGHEEPGDERTGQVVETLDRNTICACSADGICHCPNRGRDAQAVH
jgi:phage tail tape-measure protein